MNVKNTFWTLFLGLISGLLISLYFLGLNTIAEQLSQHPGLILIFPLTFLFLIFVRRHSYFFPTSFIEMREVQTNEINFWSRWLLPLNLFLSWLSHLSGASLGRESTAATLSTSLVPLFKLDWTYWRPIVLSASFAMATGYPLIAVIVIMELFYSDIQQKFLSLLCAWVGCLVMKTLAVPPLFVHENFGTDSKSFFTAVLMVFAVGICCGYLGRFYKSSGERLKKFFQNFRTKRSIAIGFISALVLTILIIRGDLSAYKSLSLQHFADIQTGKVQLEFVVIKAFLTLICVALGFIGGEFVPSLLIGSAIGVSLSSIFSENIGFGFALGIFAFFAALSKMKWTAICLVWAYFDFTTALWAYFTISLSDSLSGERKLF